MPRMARVVVPGYPHHVTQRGIHKQQTFFCDEDFQLYLSLLKQGISRVDISILAYCLMPNHVHVIVVPGKEDSLGKLFGWAHGRYAQKINKKMQWFGHLWQARRVRAGGSRVHPSDHGDSGADGTVLGHQG